MGEVASEISFAEGMDWDDLCSSVGGAGVEQEYLNPTQSLEAGSPGGSVREDASEVTPAGAIDWSDLVTGVGEFCGFLRIVGKPHF